MLEVEGLSKVFHPGTINENVAIRNVSLTVNQGDFITIIGSNGAGKSTFYNLVSGHFPPTTGRIRVHGRDVTRDAEHKRARYIGRIFQNPLLGTAGNMSLEDNMVISLKKGFKGLGISLTDKRREYFRQELQALNMGLENRLKDNVGLFSGGQRQALTLLMMVLSNPDLVLLDEHTAALDPKNAQMVMDLTLAYVEKYSLTTMMITHNMNHAIHYGNRLLMMDKGEIIYDVAGEEKRALTVEKLVKKFHEIRNADLENDEMLLSKGS
jgi:putative ABC transport system ATP-binding protein